jgi:hypothetical protein
MKGKQIESIHVIFSHIRALHQMLIQSKTIAYWITLFRHIVCSSFAFRNVTVLVLFRVTDICNTQDKMGAELSLVDRSCSTQLHSYYSLKYLGSSSILSLRIVIGDILLTEIYHGSSQAYPGKCCDNTSNNFIAASFHDPSNSPLINHHTIRSHIVEDQVQVLVCLATGP